MVWNMLAKLSKVLLVRILLIESPELANQTGTDTMTLLLHPGIVLRFLVKILDFVLVVRQVSFYPVGYVLANLVVPLQGEFITPAVNLSKVSCRQGET